MNYKLKQIQNWPELARQANWSVTALAKKCGVSIRGLELYFHKTRGITPKAWLAEKRQKQATELLGQGIAVKEVAAELGYKHAHHFSRAFKRLSGCYPTQLTTSCRKLRVLV
jgi:transcriptional regulator GlxA family with amidase domain